VIESWIEYEDSGIQKIGFVARPKIKVIIEGIEGKSRERVLELEKLN